MDIRKLIGLTLLQGNLIMPMALAAQDAAVDERYSPNLKRDYPRQVWWGDTHVHTSYSTDAGMIGNRLGPEAACL